MRKFILTLLLVALMTKTASAGLFDNVEVSRLIDENYALVQKDGWAELRIPQSLHRLDTPDSI